ncbi:MAG: NAD(P)H-dependent oxidoreductase [Bacteroidota bacterium]|nr:NAD(P)H-dependent oxidoreductase [Bacteroidota bacterium]MDP4204625.1 NAD(P)H-dependent oxidoreductase [Bacteroidota bacterium]
MNIIDKLNWRYAVKSFDPDEKLSDDQINTLKEALQLSASSFGLQPYKFVIVENPELRNKLVDVSYGQDKVAKASHFIIFCIETKLDESFIDRFVDLNVTINHLSAENAAGFSGMLKGSILQRSQEAKEEWSARQLYISIGFLLTSAAVLGIDACPMEGFDPKAYTEILGLDKLGLRPYAAVALGYRSESDPYQYHKKVRRPIEDLFVIK